MDSTRASPAILARARQLDGLFSWKMVPSRSKITFSMSRSMRKRSDQPDFEKSAGMGLSFLLTVRPPTVETSGQVPWPTLPLSSSSASSEKMNRGPHERASCSLLARRVERAAILLFRISTLVTHGDVEQLQSQLLRMKLFSHS